MVDKISITSIQNYAKQFGYECLSNVYAPKIKLKFRCDKGHEYYTIWHRFKRGDRCSICANNKVLSIEYIKKYAEQFGYVCLSTEYVNNKHKLLFECDKGHIYETSWSVFSKKTRIGGYRCPICRTRGTGIDSKGVNRIYRDKDWLYQQYVEEKLSSKDIGEFCGVGHRLILNWLYRFEISVRDIGEATSLGQYEDHSVFDLLVEEDEKLCLRCKQVKKKTEFRMCSNCRDGLQGYCKQCLNSFIPNNTSWKKYTSQELEKVELYRDRVSRLTNENFRKYYEYINPHKIPRNNKFHVDHIYSVQDGFENGVSIEVMASPINLQMLQASENSRKNRHSEIALEELYNLYNQFEEEINGEYR